MGDDHILETKWISLKEALRLVERRLGKNAKDEICDMANECKLTVRGMSDNLPYQLRYVRIGREHGYELIAKWADWENSASNYDDGIIAVIRDLEVQNDEVFRSLLTGKPIERQTNERALDEETTRSSSKPVASRETIRKAIRAVYDAVSNTGMKPPNIKELSAAAIPLLEQQGFSASGRRIQDIGEEAEFKALRRPPGTTLSSEQRGRRE